MFSRFKRICFSLFTTAICFIDQYPFNRLTGIIVSQSVHCKKQIPLGNLYALRCFNGIVRANIIIVTALANNCILQYYTFYMHIRAAVSVVMMHVVCTHILLYGTLIRARTARRGAHIHTHTHITHILYIDNILLPIRLVLLPPLFPPPLLV